MRDYETKTYRPPYEARSFLLQVTRGCSHGKCTFCTMYRGTPYTTDPFEDVLADIIEAGRLYPDTKRVFLEHGDPFCLSAARLTEIAEAIHMYMPAVQTIAMYASVKNIQTKTDGELKKLRALGINDLNIGVESGLDEALEILGKGYTAAQAEYELKRLTDAGIEYGANVIFGAAGRGLGRKNAEATARLLSAAQPNTVFTGTIHASPGAPLCEDMRSGKFRDSTIGEYLDEEETLLSMLELNNSRYYSTHPSNISGLKGRLPADKERLLSELSARRAELSDILKRLPAKYGEEGVIMGCV